MAAPIPEEECEISEPLNVSKGSERIDWEQLRRLSLQSGGFGAERKVIWPKLLNVNIPPPNSVHTTDGQPSRVDAAEEPDECDATRHDNSDGNPIPLNIDEPAAEHRDEYQIKLDTDRSFVLYPEESDTHIHKDELKSDLNRLIVSVFRNRPKLNYFQGYHDIMTVIYLTLPREIQLSFAEKISLHRLRDSMLHSMEPVLGLLRVLKSLMRLADPDYSKLLERDSPLPFYALSNLLTLFSHDIPTLPLIQHVFDYLLCRPPIAVVYLAAAVLLSKKEYILSLEGQLEPFMLHPILSSLPSLTEGFELEQRPLTNNDPNKTENDMPLQKLSEHFKRGISMSDRWQSLPQARQSSPCPDGSATGSGTDNLNTEPNAVDTIKQEPPDNHPLAGTDAYSSKPSKTPTSDASKIPSQTSSSLPELLPSPPFPPLSPSQPSKCMPTASSSQSSLDLRQPPDPIPLPSVLTRSDSLYALYPPSHPSLKLSSIMGPQSVIFTWSENFSDLPSDSTAEAMVTRPELVVYPVTPEEMEEQDTEGDGDSSGSEADLGNEEKRKHSGWRRGGKKGKRRTKSGKEGAVRRMQQALKKTVRNLLSALGIKVGDQRISPVDGRTMVAGAVIVLGVAMAVYGIQASSTNGSLLGSRGGEDTFSMGFHILRRHLQGHPNGHLHEELKKITGGLADVGAKIFNLRGG